MTQRNLIYEITGVRDRMPRTDQKEGEPTPAPTLYGYFAIDLIWRAEDGLALRDDGAVEIVDQVNVPLEADANYVLATIEAKRQELYIAMDQPGAGITIEPESVPQELLALIGPEQ